MPQETKTKTPAPPASETVSVRVVKQAVSEGGLIYTKGQTFNVTPDRAEALGELVVIVPAK